MEGCRAAAKDRGVRVGRRKQSKQKKLVRSEIAKLGKTGRKEVGRWQEEMVRK